MLPPPKKNKKKIGLILKLAVLSNPGSIQLSFSQAKADPSIAWARFAMLLHKNVVGGSNMIGFPLVIAVSERNMSGIKPGSLGWHTSALTYELQEVRQ